MLYKDEEISLQNSYATANPIIDLVGEAVVDGQKCVRLDNEFIAIPVEQYGVLMWNGKLIERIDNQLAQIAIDKSLDAQKLREKIANILHEIYSKPDTTQDIPPKAY